MSINILRSYLMKCAAIGIEPSFVGLRAYRMGVLAC